MSDRFVYFVVFPLSLLLGAFGVAWWGRILGWW